VALSCSPLCAAADHQQFLGVGAAESELAVEACAVGGHQVNALHAAQGGGGEQGLHHLTAEPTALQVAGHHHVPEHGPAEPIAGGTAKAHHPLASPEAHHCLAAGKQLPQLGMAAALGPERMFIQQSLKLEQASAGAQAWSQAEPTQAGSPGSVLDQLHVHHGSILPATGAR